MDYCAENSDAWSVIKLRGEQKWHQYLHNSHIESILIELIIKSNAACYQTKSHGIFYAVMWYRRSQHPHIKIGCPFLSHGILLHGPRVSIL